MFKKIKKATKKQIYAACEHLEVNKGSYYSGNSVMTLSQAMGLLESLTWYSDCKDLIMFYDKLGLKEKDWGFENSYTVEGIDERILALLLYLEARDYV